MKLTKGTVAVVTGAGSGIGRALALALARKGAALALADKDAHNAATTAADAKRAGAATVSSHAVDVADLAAMTRFRDEVKKAHGRAQLLVNNAGVALGGTFEEVTLDDMRWLIEINFWGTVYGTKLFLPLLRAERRAHIVNLSSIFGIIAPPGQTAYAASKFAVRGFSEALRHELAESGIRVTQVHPGGVRTNIARDARLPAGFGADRRDAMVKRFAHMARTTPDAAAERILRGVERDEARILVGADARLLAALQWLMPTGYWRAARHLFARPDARRSGGG
ncbi:MAG TPA: SDR family NAD(P)-dependent oxidoreductase [Stellaceae bacterium]|nr:SDR family NAD(P)-dependent oxidoreductase [Stellaceae bacterium]